MGQGISITFPESDVLLRCLIVSQKKRNSLFLGTTESLHCCLSLNDANNKSENSVSSLSLRRRRDGWSFFPRPQKDKKHLFHNLGIGRLSATLCLHPPSTGPTRLIVLKKRLHADSSSFPESSRAESRHFVWPSEDRRRE